jgi:hypothetical protein
MMDSVEDNFNKIEEKILQDGWITNSYLYWSVCLVLCYLVALGDECFGHLVRNWCSG